ncbi:hypothetical protein HBF24_09885 [Oleiagrimonas sp. C23AA]|nr:hypothetical protein [Oleiagrimonas sp. C23AA]
MTGFAHISHVRGVDFASPAPAAGEAEAEQGALVQAFQRVSSQAASIASSSDNVIAVFLRARSPRLTAARVARLSTVRIAGCSQG